MRVLVVTNMYPVENSPSYGIFVAEQVRSLREAGLIVDDFFVNPRRTRLNYFASIPALVRKLRSEAYDVVHTHHTYSLFLVNLARRLASTRVPVVLTNHEGEVLDMGRRTRTWHPSSRLRHWRFLKQLAARRADFVISVSERLSTSISANGRGLVIPCGVDLDKFTPLDKNRCRERLKLPSDALVVFFPTSPQAKGKRFGLAKAAFEKLRERVSDSVLLTGGGIPNEMMPVYYNAADAVLQTSFYEASPTVVKESLACEIPLVSTDSGDTREVIDGVPNCYLCADDPDEIALRIAACFGQRAEGGRKQLRQAGLGLDQVALRVIAVYRQLVKPRD